MNRYPSVLAGFLAIMLSAPNMAHGYGVAYYEATYYSQSTYTFESSYNITFTTNATSTRDFVVSGLLQKGSGTFRIDHPLDPKNKLLYHSFVESPDAKNMYDGVVTLDARGEATIILPDYFEALNKDFRYQMKPIGEPMPDLHVKSEIHDNRFSVGGGKAGGRISWQVTGTRHDPYIEANPIRVEVEKGAGEWVNRGDFFYEGYERARFPTHRFVTYVRDLFGRR